MSKDIQGVEIRSFPINEMQVKGSLVVSFSDIAELGKKTVAGRPANLEFREMFLDSLVSNLQESVEQRKKSNVEDPS